MQEAYVPEHDSVFMFTFAACASAFEPSSKPEIKKPTGHSLHGGRAFQEKEPPKELENGSREKISESKTEKVCNLGSNVIL